MCIRDSSNDINLMRISFNILFYLFLSFFFNITNQKDANCLTKAFMYHINELETEHLQNISKKINESQIGNIFIFKFKINF